MWRHEEADHSALRIPVLANEVRTELKGSILGAAGLSLVVGYLAWRIGPLSSIGAAAWFAAMVAIIAAWLCAAAVFAHARPDDATIIRFWAPLARNLMRACDLAIAASVWILMPPADEALRGLLTILYVWFLVLQILVSTEATRVTGFAIVTILGSLIAFTAGSDTAMGGPTAFFLAVFGCTMFAANRLVRAAVIEAMTARIMAERSATALRTALASVAAEREAKDRFIASASHDLQQPIQAARLFFERAVSTPDGSVRQQAVGGARSAFASVEKLLDTMLMHLRLGAGGLSARREPVRIEDVLAGVALENGAAAEAERIRVRLVETSLIALGDGELLKRALNNLVGNSVRHSGGSKLLLGARRSGAAEVTIWVIDDGSGIAEADLGTLFEEYRQGRTTARGGFGIGLSAVQRMMDLQGGEVGLDRRWMSGSAFWLRLPLADGGTAGEAERERAGERSERCAAA